ncbi:AbrB/MazE/SpoVT family DNA-binding domain-containing protein [Chitinimonas arctica]|uniref:AbrB/MazE/SpoVT family DNA-binding domain-containing protein n=1 Tax=Chitinimonas arctica TaxID=2594795 RepID=A0A516SLS5_9NEIS|nr:AbrB/MazE/SpoVT family DNA-binding domain-containing protein [Chitinimonas arctica]QDQ29102.1 AbrB/MazE/SpoVT family DNA-binding domain-containing protein [Chitinimonas arctica]
MELPIRRIGNSAGVVIPAPLLQQLKVAVGGSLNATIQGETLTLTSAKPRYKLADLLAEMPGELPRVDGWDEMPPVGREVA